MFIPVLLFLFLQVCDVVTTLAGLSLGAREASPFVLRLMWMSGPVAGLLVSKAVCLLLLGLCLIWRRRRLLWMANAWFFGLVLWNLYMLDVVGV